MGVGGVWGEVRSVDEAGVRGVRGVVGVYVGELASSESKIGSPVSGASPSSRASLCFSSYWTRSALETGWSLGMARLLRTCCAPDREPEAQVLRVLGRVVRDFARVFCVHPNANRPVALRQCVCLYGVRDDADLRHSVEHGPRCLVYSTRKEVYQRLIFYVAVYDTKLFGVNEPAKESADAAGVGVSRRNVGGEVWCGCS